MATKGDPEEGVIRRGELYTMKHAMARLGLARAAMRTLRADGLPVVKIEGRAFILGDDIIDHFQRLKSQAGKPHATRDR